MRHQAIGALLFFASLAGPEDVGSGVSRTAQSQKPEARSHVPLDSRPVSLESANWPTDRSIPTRSSSNQQRIGTRVLRHQPSVGYGAIHPAGGRHRLSRLTDLSPRRYGRSLVTNADRDSIQVVERSIRGRPDRVVSRPLGTRLEAGDVLALHIACRLGPMMSCMADTRSRPHRTWCGWEHSVRGVNARC